MLDATTYITVGGGLGIMVLISVLVWHILYEDPPRGPADALDAVMLAIPLGMITAILWPLAVIVGMLTLAVWISMRVLDPKEGNE